MCLRFLWPMAAKTAETPETRANKVTNNNDNDKKDIDAADDT